MAQQTIIDPGSHLEQFEIKMPHCQSHYHAAMQCRSADSNAVRVEMARAGCTPLHGPTWLWPVHVSRPPLVPPHARLQSLGDKARGS